jgi:hypothetical protein
LGIGCITYTIYRNGTWGLNKTVGWAWDITNFVWWVGIGHAGTLISAVLLLFRQRWRMAINRSAEAMTISQLSSWFIPNYSFVHGCTGYFHTKSIWVLMGEF